jgi:hypothetical protein
MEEQVTISKREYEKLVEDQAFLEALRACGVDNWDGYSDAHDYLNDLEDADVN